MAIVIKNKKDASFSNERPYVVVTYVRNHNSRFAAGELTSIKYELKYDLRPIYPQFRNKETNTFDAEAASELFIKELPVGSNENVNLFDFTIKELTDSKHFAVNNHLNGGIMSVWHVACYSDEREWARKYAQNDLETKIKKNLVSWDY